MFLDPLIKIFAISFYLSWKDMTLDTPTRERGFGGDRDRDRDRDRGFERERGGSSGAAERGGTWERGLVTQGRDSVDRDRGYDRDG